MVEQFLGFKRSTHLISKNFKTQPKTSSASCTKQLEALLDRCIRPLRANRFRIAVVNSCTKRLVFAGDSERNIIVEQGKECTSIVFLLFGEASVEVARAEFCAGPWLVDNRLSSSIPCESA